MPSLFGILFVVAGLALFVLAWRYYRRQRVIADTPTAKAQSKAVGPVELKGAAVALENASAAVAPFSAMPALCWRVTVEEERTRTVTHRQGDRTVQRQEKYWASIHEARHLPRFGLRDETGIAAIDPMGGDPAMPAMQRWGSELLRAPPTSFTTHLDAHKISTQTWLGFTRRLRFTERRLPPETTLYVLGTAIPSADISSRNAALVVQKEGRVPFVISAKGERSLVTRYALIFWLCLIGAIVLTTFGAISLGAP